MSTVHEAWSCLRSEADERAGLEPLIGQFLNEAVLSHDSLDSALALLVSSVAQRQLKDVSGLLEKVRHIYAGQENIVKAAAADLLAYFNRDSACNFLLQPFLFYKGFKAIQTHRIANALWANEEKILALLLQSCMSEMLSIDIHPAAQIGSGIMIDHATGIVIGETTIIEDDVSIMQNVTLGGTGKDVGNRHPIIKRGSLISSGAKILGRITIGEGAKVGAGSVVLNDVLPHTTVVGIPARVVGRPRDSFPAYEMNHDFER